MSKLISLEAENVKRLIAVRIVPDGNMVVVGGSNGAGKSSVLDSIAMALGGGGEIPAMPVRRGEEKATIILETDDGWVIKRTFTKAGGTALVIENKDKLRAGSPQELLNKLTGKLTFDPLAFTNLEGKAQAAALKRLVNLDTTALDAKRKQLYDERTLINRQAETAGSKVEFMPFHPEAPAEEQSVTAIVAERDTAKEHNSQLAGLEKASRTAGEALAEASRGRAGLVFEIAQIEERLKALGLRLKELDEAIPAINTRLEAARKAHEEFKAVDLSPINLRLANAETVNGWVRQNQARAAAQREAQAIEDKAQAITGQINEIDRQRSEALSAVQYPVEGLGFDANGVTFGGVPFDQASGAERLRVSVAIAAALNPKLRVMLVRDGSLLDEQSLQLLGELAVKHDLQCWVERVSRGKECSVIIENGEVEQAPVTEDGANYSKATQEV